MRMVTAALISLGVALIAPPSLLAEQRPHGPRFPRVAPATEQAIERLRAQLAQSERTNGADHEATGVILNQLASLYTLARRGPEAADASARAMAIAERVFGANDPRIIPYLGPRAAALAGLGNYREAIPMQRRVVTIREATSGPDHLDTLGAVHDLARFFDRYSLLSEKEPPLRRAYEGRRRILGDGHVDTLAVAFDLATYLWYENRLAEAEPLLASIVEHRDALGADRIRRLPVSAWRLANIRHDRPAQAEPLYQLAMAEAGRSVESYVPDVDRHHLAWDYASLLARQGRHEEAEPHHRYTFDEFVRVGHGYRNEIAEALTIDLLTIPGRAGEAAGPAAALLRESSGSLYSSFEPRRRRLLLNLDAAWAAAEAAGRPGAADPGSVFPVMQEALTGPASRSIIRQAARRYLEDADPEVSPLLDERSRIEDEILVLREQLRGLPGAMRGETLYDILLPGQDVERNRLSNEILALRNRLDEGEARLAQVNPRFRDLFQAPTYTVADVQAAISPDDAVLLVTPARFGTHVILVTRETANWRRSAWDAQRVEDAVGRLRWDVGATVRLPPEEIARRQAERPDNAPPAFDRRTAYALHQELVAPFAGQLRGKRRLYIIAGGSLAGLPFSLLVSRPPTGADFDPRALRATRWFADDHALVHLPSLQALVERRRDTAPSSGAAGFVGIGDPLLDGPPVVRARRSGEPAELTALFRPGGARGGGGVADVSQLRRLARLPGTGVELERVRAALGASPVSVLSAAAATEPAVRGLDLSQVRYLLFSTHGLTAEEADGAWEPGLVLTPPAERDVDQVGAERDGYLAASEVAGMKLNAEWVILSACNTATGEDSANLSALARAFFVAGARNLLASHWPVSDEVAPVLIPRILRLERGGMGRAEAVQRAMREIRDGDPRSGWAHPFYWAPFVLMGDAG